MNFLKPRREFLQRAAMAAAGWAAAGAASPGRFWAEQAKAAKEGSASSMPIKYEPSWESLSQYKVPDWYRDAKFGIFLHWGVYSVPAYSSEWYPRLMYRRD